MVRLVEVSEQCIHATSGEPTATNIYEFDDGYRLREIGAPYFGEPEDYDALPLERWAIELRLSLDARNGVLSEGLP